METIVNMAKKEKQTAKEAQMKVLFVSPGLNPTRGGERVILRYAKTLAEKGHDSTILIPNFPQEYDFAPLKILKYKPLLPHFYSHQTGYFDAVNDALKVVDNDYDIIVGTYVPQLIVSISILKKQKNAKFVILNQDFSAMFTKRPERQLMFKFYPKYADKIISDSTFCADEIKKFSGKISVVIPIGVEEGYYPREKKDFDKYIMWVGSRNKHKGFAEFMQAMDIVWKEHPTMQLKIVGGEFIDDQRIEYLEPRGNVDMLAEYYSNARLFVCSSYQEGFGLPALEAMRCGCPVVTTDTGGCLEYAKDNYNSFVVPPKDANALSKKILTVLNDEALSQTFIKNGLESSQKFNWENVTRQFEEELLTLI